MDKKEQNRQAQQRFRQSQKEKKAKLLKAKSILENIIFDYQGKDHPILKRVEQALALLT